jgi:hypothetical protein
MNMGLFAHPVKRSVASHSVASRSKVALGALVLALLLALGPALADAALHTALVPAALAGGPQSGDGG